MIYEFDISISKYHANAKRLFRREFPTFTKELHQNLNTLVQPLNDFWMSLLCATHILSFRGDSLASTIRNTRWDGNMRVTAIRTLINLIFPVRPVE